MSGVCLGKRESLNVSPLPIDTAPPDPHPQSFDCLIPVDN